MGHIFLILPILKFLFWLTIYFIFFSETSFIDTALGWEADYEICSFVQDTLNLYLSTECIDNFFAYTEAETNALPILLFRLW